MDIQSIFNKFIQECQNGTLQRRSAPTIENYIRSMDLLLKTVSISDISSLTEQVLRQFIMHGENDRKWLPNTSVTYRKNLRPFTKWCVAKGYLAQDPFQNIPYPKLNKKLPDYYSHQEIDNILYQLNMATHNKFVCKRNEAMFGVLLLAGLRKGELLGLNFRDVNFEQNLLRVRSENTKDRADRVIPMSRRLVEVLKQYIELRNSKKPETMALWISDHGKRFSRHGWNHLMKDLSRRTKFPVKTHKMRHTFATHYYSASLDPVGLQQLLGHSDINTTMIYAHAMPENLRSSVEANPLANLF